jgi:hypothetical protein
MKKISFLITIILLLITPLTAAEKKDCSELKKFSKEFFTCKSTNVKSGIKNKLSKSNNPLKGLIDYQKKAWSKKN